MKPGVKKILRALCSTANSGLRRASAVLAACLALGVPVAAASGAGEVRVAVASNFSAAARALGDGFARATGHGARFSFGSTGVLYTQIDRGAPFDVFLAADAERPRRAVAAGLAVAGSRLTYARGRLVLFSRDPLRVLGPESLVSSRDTRLAVANPVTAPYGAAAVAALRGLGVYDAVASRLVRGNNIGQVYQFVETGNAELGLVALSQVSGHDAGSRWLVPQSLHPPIEQDAVLLRRGADNPAARAFMEWLSTAEAATIIRGFGYTTVD